MTKAKLFAAFWAAFAASTVIVGLGCFIALVSLLIHAHPVATMSTFVGIIWGSLAISIYDEMKQRGVF